MEVWKPVLEFEGLYEVSSTGRVRSLDKIVRNTAVSSRMIRGQVVTPYIRPAGYATVRLSRAAKKRSCYVHRLVAAAFHGAGKPGDEVCHRDGQKLNNAATNLYWGSRTQNMADRGRLGEAASGERHGQAKLTAQQVAVIMADPRLHREIAAEHGVSRELIGMIKRGKIWRGVQG